MRTRLELREILIQATELDKLYYQPPATIQMKYPCIVYGFLGYATQNADDLRYLGHKKYMVTIIDKDPDSVYPDRMLEIPFCEFDRYYTSDNMNHWVFSVYF